MSCNSFVSQKLRSLLQRHILVHFVANFHKICNELGLFVVANFGCGEVLVAVVTHIATVLLIKMFTQEV